MRAFAAHPHTTRRHVWHTLLFTAAALIVLLAAAAAAPQPQKEDVGEHQCGFDALNARTIGTRVSGISRVVQPPHQERHAKSVHDAAEGSPMAITASSSASTNSNSSAWESIRIRVFTEDLSTDGKYCTAAGQNRPDFSGSTATCTSEDVLTSGKKKVLTELLIPSAIQLHEDRLNVQRISGNIVVDSSITTDEICGQFVVPSSHMSTGVSDADFILYMSAGPTSGNTIAWATTCQYFSNGRPAVGVSNVSPKYISADPQTVRVITHELLHALGFSITTFQARSMVASTSLRGKSAAPVITSSAVVAKAQEQYGCSTQQYMELEDEGGSGTAYSHWKRRSAKDELMAGISGVGYYTALTIAAMEDMGFYKGNYDNAEPMTYGQNAGCSLLTSKCVINGVSQFSSMFCASSTTDMVCTSDHRAVGYCDVVSYKSSLPSYFQYFADTTKGGRNALMDYCPYIQGYSNTNCSTDTGILLGSVFGVNSRCFDAPSGITMAGAQYSQLALCASVQCGTSTYGVKVRGASGYTTCTPGATLKLSSLSSKFSAGTLTCPSYDDVCVGQVNATLYEEYSDDLGDSVSAPHALHALVSFVIIVLLAMCVW